MLVMTLIYMIAPIILCLANIFLMKKTSHWYVGNLTLLVIFGVLTYLRVYFLLPSRNLLNIIISNGFWGWSLRESYFSFGLNLLITKMAMMIMEAEKTVKIIIIPKINSWY